MEKLNKLVFIILISIFSINHQIVKASETYKDIPVGRINSVYDGDTFRANLGGGYSALIGKNIPIRLSGVDTPEIKGKCKSEKSLAVKARDFVREKLEVAKKIRLSNVQRGKYFRIVATVKIDGYDLSEQLVKKGLAYRYYGGKKKSWCND